MALAALVFGFTFFGQDTNSSSLALAAAQATAYRVSVDAVPQGSLSTKELGAQSLARHKQTVAAQVSQYIAAVKAAQLSAFLGAVAANEQRQQQAKAATAVPVSQPVGSSDAGGWAAVAMCEEGGNNDPNYGYYGIKEWNGFDGYPTAGSAPQSVQLQWEAQNVGAPPNESGGCHSY